MQQNKINYSTPQFTVITVVFNDSRFIEKTIESVISQEDVELEYIIIDGGSTDGTLEKIISYGSKIKQIVSEADKGIYDAMNKGIALAEGGWLIFMNSGDVFNNNLTLKLIHKYLDDDVNIFYGNTYAQYDNLSLIRKLNTYDPKYLVTKMVMNHQSCIIRTDFHTKNLYNIDYKICADYDMILRSYLSGGKFKKLDEVIAIVSVGGVSDNNRPSTFKEVYSIQKKNGVKGALTQYYSNIVYYTTTKLIKSISPKKINDFFYNLKYRN